MGKKIRLILTVEVPEEHLQEDYWEGVSDIVTKLHSHGRSFSSKYKELKVTYKVLDFEPLMDDI